jgi:hypothetical protein
MGMRTKASSFKKGLISWDVSWIKLKDHFYESIWQVPELKPDLHLTTNHSHSHSHTTINRILMPVTDAEAICLIESWFCMFLERL